MCLPLRAVSTTAVVPSSNIPHSNNLCPAGSRRTDLEKWNFDE